MDSAQGDLGPKPKIEMHFLPKIAAFRPCVNIKIPKELKELKFRTGRSLQSKGKILKSHVEKVKFGYPWTKP